MQYGILFLAAFLGFSHTLRSEITYYFQNNSALQRADSYSEAFSWGLSSITTDGTKGYISNQNIIKITLNNTTLEIPEIEVTSGFTINNLFATESHLGFANPLVSRFSSYASNPNPLYDQYFSKIGNQNFTLDILDEFDNTITSVKYVFQYGQLSGKTTPFGPYPNGVRASDYTINMYGPTPPWDHWYYLEYSASDLFSNYGATDASGGYDIGTGIFGFSVANSTDSSHMASEMISDGFSVMVIPNTGYWGPLNPMVIASSVPEPSALSLLAIGLSGLAIIRRRRS